MPSSSVVIIGAGPAGLMAAQTLLQAGVKVDIYDAMPSVGRKFLLAGRGGLNLTHSEAPIAFATRYGARVTHVARWLKEFDAVSLRQWAHDLGIETFVGSSGRVFPKEMKAAPLLRAWLHRLRSSGATVHTRHVWQGWTDNGALRLESPKGAVTVQAKALILALGGASWPRLGSNALWQAALNEKGVPIATLQPANCGFDTTWSDHFITRFAGQPLKSIATSPDGDFIPRLGECMVTQNGLEGNSIYAWSAPLREAINAQGSAQLNIDLLPARSLASVRAEVARPRGARSLSSHLRSRLGLSSLKVGLLHECLPAKVFQQPLLLSQAIKHLPVTLHTTRPIAEAISSAGGVMFEALDENQMLRALPGVFCAGEMLDWEAPTGGYLLTACFASGRATGAGVLQWLNRSS